ncbi:MAG: DUF1835 domain-containing protein [Kofleriaceae bacterium]
MERIVHICNGDMTADQLSLAELPGEIRVWADALNRGPVLPVGDAEHYAARSAYWAQHEHPEAKDKLVAYDRDLDSALAAEEVILWFEHDLFDQLALIRILSRIARKGLPQTLTIVSIDRHPAVPNFLGLGELSPEQLAALWPQRAPLSRDSIDEAITTFIALTSADPRGLPFLARRVKALPFLAGAIERHLEEFPDPTSGLSRTERQVLAAIARGEGSADALMQGSAATDPRYPLTDGYLVATLASLGAAGFVDNAPTTLAALKDASPAVTALGRQALAGAIDRVHEAGIDTWRGGVHLTGKGPVWRWDSRERKLVEK